MTGSLGVQGRRHRNERCARLAGAVALAAVLFIPGEALAITGAEASAIAKKAVKQQSISAFKLKASCLASTGVSTTCTAAWVTRGRTYTGKITLKQATVGTNYIYAYKLIATGRAKRPPAKILRRSGKVTVAIPKGRTRTNPLPLGSTAFGHGWNVTVLGITPDATSQVLAENPFNEPPEAGKQFLIARVRATFTGEPSQSFDGGFRLRAVGASAVEYKTFTDSCGVIPDPITDNTVFTGGTIEGNVCWQVRSADASSLVMFDQGSLGADTRPTFFALGD